MTIPTSDRQWTFLLDVRLLIQHAKRKGWKLTGGNLYRTPAQNTAVNGTARSRHLDRLAIDLNLFIDDVYQRDTEAYRPLGEFWEALRPDNSWGGRFNDGNHFSVGER